MQFIATIPLTDLCMATERRLGSRVAKCWWDQACLDLEEVRMEAQESELDEGEEEKDRM